VLGDLKVHSDERCEETFNKKLPNAIDQTNFQNIEFYLNLFQESLNNKKMTIADLPKASNFQKLLDLIQNSNNTVINMVMKKFNMNRINNLLVEDLISEELIIAILKELDYDESISVREKHFYLTYES
jgi:GTPase Era involved in 16S rRNA processing